jgi:hypothetical protein
MLSRGRLQINDAVRAVLGSAAAGAAHTIKAALPAFAPHTLNTGAAELEYIGCAKQHHNGRRHS